MFDLIWSDAFCEKVWNMKSLHTTDNNRYRYKVMTISSVPVKLRPRWLCSYGLQLPVQSVPITTKVVSLKPYSWQGELNSTFM